jgi:hypothetical protein
MYSIAAALSALVFTLPASDKADARARTIAPFVDGQTVAVAHVDLTRLDADALLDWVAEVGRVDKKELEETRREGRTWLADFTKAGGKDLYFVLNLNDLPRELIGTILPLADGVDAQAVRRVLERIGMFKQLHLETHGQVLLGGGEAVRKRLKNVKPVERPALAKAFAAAGDTAVQLIVLPPPDTRRIVEELLPTLPPQLGGGSTRPLTHGLLWAALGVDMPPKYSIRLSLQSPDAESAEKLKDALVPILKSAAQQRGAREFYPDIGRLAEKLTPQVDKDRLTLAASDKELKEFLPIVVRRVYLSETRGQVENRLHQLAVAMHNYAGSYKNRFPATANFDKQGKPLLSWRVHLLPFLDQQELYRQFHLDEPWDSPHNKKLLALMPQVYQGPNRALNREGKTIYLLPTGKHAAFKDGPEGPRMPADFPDGTSNTILIVEADDAHAAPWTKPEDLPIDPEHPQRGLGGHYPDGFLTVIADGSMRFVAKTISQATLRAAFTPAGSEVLGPDW